jgi:hypothetical protein
MLSKKRLLYALAGVILKSLLVIFFSFSVFSEEDPLPLLSLQDISILKISPAHIRVFIMPTL